MRLSRLLGAPASSCLAPLLHTFAAFASSCLALGCNGSIDVTPGDAGGPPLACTPGAQKTCSCPNHGEGITTCDADGSGFGACTGCDIPWSASISSEDGNIGSPYRGLAVLPGGGVVVPYQILGEADSVDTHLRRYDAQGNVSWDVPAVDWMVAASNGSSPVTVAARLGNGSTTVLGKTLTCAAAWCALVGQLDDTGAFAWARAYEPGSDGIASPTHVAVAGDGRIVIAGTGHGTMDFGTGPVELLGHGSFVAAFSPAGDALWAHAITAGDSSCQLLVDALAVSSAGDVAIGGVVCNAAETIDFGTGTVAGPASNSGNMTNFFAKLDAGGAVVFGRPASPGDFGHTRVALTSSGELVLSAGLDGVVDLGGGPLGMAGESQQVLAKLSPAGDVVWSRSIASSTKQLGASWVQVDATDHIWLAAAALPGMTFQGAPIVSTGARDALLLEYASSGDDLAKWQFAAAEPDGISACAIADNGDPVIAGAYTDSIDLGQGPLVNAGGRDIFVAKLVP
jgi:hypothetical protein